VFETPARLPVAAAGSIVPLRETCSIASLVQNVMRFRLLLRFERVRQRRTVERLERFERLIVSDTFTRFMPVLGGNRQKSNYFLSINYGRL